MRIGRSIRERACVCVCVCVWCVCGGGGGGEVGKHGGARKDNFHGRMIKFEKI